MVAIVLPTASSRVNLFALDWFEGQVVLGLGTSAALAPQLHSRMAKKFRELVILGGLFVLQVELFPFDTGRSPCAPHRARY